MIVVMLLCKRNHPALSVSGTPVELFSWWQVRVCLVLNKTVSVSGRRHDWISSEGYSAFPRFWLLGNDAGAELGGDTGPGIVALGCFHCSKASGSNTFRPYYHIHIHLARPLQPIPPTTYSYIEPDHEPVFAIFLNFSIAPANLLSKPATDRPNEEAPSQQP